MIPAALYFLITIAMVPQFGDLERTYRTGKTSITVLSNCQLLPLLLGAVTAFSTSLIANIIYDKAISPDDLLPDHIKSQRFPSISLTSRKLPWT